MSARQDKEPDLSAFPRIAVIHGPKSALRPPQHIVWNPFIANFCLMAASHSTKILIPTGSLSPLILKLPSLRQGPPNG
jgi:hypothetical protein